jgi:hypothetical protein
LFASFGGGVLANSPGSAGRADEPLGRFVAIALGFYPMNQGRATGKKGGSPELLDGLQGFATTIVAAGMTRNRRG